VSAVASRALGAEAAVPLPGGPVRRSAPRAGSPDFYAELKRRVSIADAARMCGREVELRARGGKLLGGCPHCGDGESGTRFQVDPERQLFHCKSCGHGGDVIGLVALLRQLDNAEARDWLAAQVGMPPLGCASPAEQAAIAARHAEERRVRRVLAVAVDYFQAQLPEVLREALREQWGLTRETLECFKVGYAPTGDGLLAALDEAGIPFEDATASGLLVRTGAGWKSLLQGRIVFPYLLAPGGEAVYAIGRKVTESLGPVAVPARLVTPAASWERAKYKKLLTHDPHRAPYVSQAVANDHLFGDACRGPSLLLTEGITDALAAIQAGYPCLSPATVRFAKRDWPRLLRAARRYERVYVVNDSEESRAGEEGARATAAFLEREGIKVYLAELPRAADQAKVDLCEYLRSGSPADLEGLLRRARSLFALRLEAVHPDTAPEQLADALRPALELVAAAPEDREPERLAAISQRFHLQAQGPELVAIRAALRRLRGATEVEAETSGSDGGEPQDQRPSAPSSSTGDTIPGDDPLAELERRLVWRWGRDGERIAVKPLSANLHAILELHPEIPRFWLNDFDGDIYLSDRRVEDADYTAVRVWLSETYEVDWSFRTIAETVALVARRRRRNPLAEWLTALQWDGVPRLDSWLEDHAGTAGTVIHRAYARRFLIGAVARVLEPGCQMDNTLILVGDQGAGKSSLFRILAGDRHFNDSGIDVRSKDAYIALRGTWIVEFPELYAFRRAEVEAIKSFLTSRVDRYRPPYGRTEVEVPRSTVFCGTTNNSSFLSDDTGNRRFWCVRVGSTLDREGLAAARDQLIAEAVAAFLAGEQWWLTDEEKALQAEAVGAFEEDDSWTDHVRKYLERHPRPVVARDVIDDLKERFGCPEGSATDKRAYSILRRLGLKPGRDGAGPGRRRVWAPPSALAAGSSAP